MKSIFTSDAGWYRQLQRFVWTPAGQLQSTGAHQCSWGQSNRDHPAFLDMKVRKCLTATSVFGMDTKIRDSVWSSVLPIRAWEVNVLR